MDVIPAIDLINGKVARLSRGDPRTLKRYLQFSDPVTTAKKWEADGAEIIHLIDLDAALNRGNNFAAIDEIAKAIKIPIQVGGGIRTIEAVKNVLSMGINRIILGSLAFTNQNALIKIQERFDNLHLIVALDHLNGVIMIDGWKRSAKTSLDAAISKFSDLHIRNFLVTSIRKDGTLTGPDFTELRKACSHPVHIIAAGGVKSLKELLLLRRIGVQGVVVGKALYEGYFTLKEALKIVKE